MSDVRSRTSVWGANQAKIRGKDYFPALNSEIHCEVCVVGGGITGTSLALLLAQEGVDVVLLEAAEIGSGTTGASTAHVDPLTDTRLAELREKFGLENAREILKSNLEAMDLVESWSKRHAPSCGYTRVYGTLLAETQGQLQTLRQELNTALELDLEAELIEDSSRPFDVAGKLCFNHHARFDPWEYVFQIAKAGKQAGARIFEKSRALKIKDGEVELKGAKVKAEHVVLATHTPAGFHPVLQSKIYPFRSYVIGARIEGEIQDALYWDLDDPYHYLRKAQDDQGDLLLIGGGDHKTGEPGGKPIEALAAYAKKRFNVSSIDYAWSSQFYKSADGMPYIGKMFGEENLWVATGYEGNGITFGTVAAQMLKDLIVEGVSRYSGLYSPSRLNLGLSGKRMAKENAAAARDFVMDRLDRSHKKIDDVALGDGAIVEHNGEQLACYKDPGGNVHLLDPACTHAKCHVRWNGFEKSWDCPCHGGRFKGTGEVIYGPPTQDLKKTDVYADRAGKRREGPEERPAP